jgi:hypothetical protein
MPARMVKRYKYRTARFSYYRSIQNYNGADGQIAVPLGLKSQFERARNIESICVQ